MGRTSVAPRQLPMAPPPLEGELVSSWLSRVAAANCIGLEELLDGVCLVNRWSRCPSECLDVNLDLVMHLALSDFCRVPSELVSQWTLTSATISRNSERNVPLISKFFQYLGISNNMPRQRCFLSGLSPRSRSDGRSCLHSRGVEPRIADALRVHLRPLRSRCPVCFSCRRATTSTCSFLISSSSGASFSARRV